jgi:IS6 family transposase
VAESDPFKWRHYRGEIILLCVRWYLRYALSYRDLEEMMRERGLSVAHTTIYRWVQAYAPELEKSIRPHLRPTNDSYRIDETYVKVKGAWKYLYRVVDSTGQTIDFLLSAKRDTKAAKRFFRKMLKAPKHQSPRVSNVDRNKAYPPAVAELKEEGILPIASQLRQSKYLNNIIGEPLVIRFDILQCAKPANRRLTVYWEIERFSDTAASGSSSASSLAKLPKKWFLHIKRREP